MNALYCSSGVSGKTPLPPKNDNNSACIRHDHNHCVIEMWDRFRSITTELCLHSVPWTKLIISSVIISSVHSGWSCVYALNWNDKNLKGRRIFCHTDGRVWKELDGGNWAEKYPYLFPFYLFSHVNFFYSLALDSLHATLLQVAFEDASLLKKSNFVFFHPMNSSLH